MMTEKSGDAPYAGVLRYGNDPRSIRARQLKEKLYATFYPYTDEDLATYSAGLIAEDSLSLMNSFQEHLRTQEVEQTLVAEGFTPAEIVQA